MPLRRTLLYLSGQPALRRWAETHPLARKLSSRFVAGSTLDEALAACRKIRGEGIAATLDYLGENVRTLDEAAACRDMYLAMIAALHAEGLEPNVSLKLTQFGLELDEAACEANVETLVAAAAAIGVLPHYRGWALLALLAIPLGLLPARLAVSAKNGRELLPMLATTARLQLGVGALLTLGLLLVRP